MRPVHLTFILLFAFTALADEKKADDTTPVKHTIHTGYFVSNKYEPKSPESFVVITNQEHFDSVFGAAFVQRDKSNRLPKDAFKTHVVIAVIKRGKATWTYEVEKLTETAGEGDKPGILAIHYKTTSQKHDTAEFAVPLIVSLPKKTYRQVRFVENGKEVKSIEQ